MSSTAARPFHPPSDPRWQALHSEPALEPALEIVDAHHHLFDRPSWPYRLEDLLDDFAGGHRVRSSVYVQCGEQYLAEGPAHLRPVGETRFVDAAARRALHMTEGAVHACAAIVGFADLTLGAAVDEVLEAHLRAAPTRFRGIRHGLSTDPDPAYARSGPRPSPGLMADPAFREGFARLAPHGLSFDAWLYHPQIPELLELARAFPDTNIVLDHVGGPLGLGGYAGRRDEVFAQWRDSIRALADCPNVVVKLGGLGMRLTGFGFDEGRQPPDSTTLAAAWKPWIDTCIEAFGAERAMFESNFPVDGCSCSYGVLWNAFKRITADASADEKAALYQRTARRVYRI
ncbi:MAG: amidohydrolase family protein [Burkholderiaceae bacterium]